MALANTQPDTAQQLQPKWTPKQRLYQEWLALPHHLRRPKLQDDFAKEIGVDRATLWRWTQKPGFQDAVYSSLRESMRRDVPEMIEHLRIQASMGKIEAIRDWLAITGFHAPKQEQPPVNVNVDARSVNITPDAAAKLLELAGRA